MANGKRAAKGKARKRKKTITPRRFGILADEQVREMWEDRKAQALDLVGRGSEAEANLRRACELAEHGNPLAATMAVDQWRSALHMFEFGRGVMWQVRDSADRRLRRDAKKPRMMSSREAWAPRGDLSKLHFVGIPHAARQWRRATDTERDEFVSRRRRSAQQWRRSRSEVGATRSAAFAWSLVAPFVVAILTDELARAAPQPVTIGDDDFLSGHHAMSKHLMRVTSEVRLLRWHLRRDGRPPHASGWAESRINRLLQLHMHKEHLAMGDRYAKRTGKHRDTKHAYVLGANVFSNDVMLFEELRNRLGVKQSRTTDLVTEHGIERVYKGKRAVGIRRKDAEAFGIES